MIYQDNSVYDGYWKNNKRDGQGILQSYYHGVLVEYRGAFVKDLKHGEGTLLFETNDKNIYSFTGRFTEGNHEGQGIIYYTDGSYYQGRIDENFVRNETGTLKFANGDFYDGDWKKNERDGKGKCTFSNRDIYDGDWKDDKIEGVGIMSYSNGDVYSGDWLHGVREGKGVMTYAAGHVYRYEGDWVDGEPNGIGEMTYRNGNCHQGEFSQGKPCGEGEFHDADGDSFQTLL